MKNYLDPNAIEALRALDPSTVVRSYSGRHGCACGCRGNYSDKRSVINACIAKMRRLADSGAIGVWMSSTDGRPSFIVVDTETRTSAIYFSEVC